jgi:hypothetical protein
MKVVSKLQISRAILIVVSFRVLLSLNKKMEPWEEKLIC